MSRHVTRMTIEDAEHYTEDERAAIIASYPVHERDARAKGIPILGSGRVFPVPEEDILTPAVPIQDHWAVIGGLDFGWDHPTAATKLAWDRDADVIYVTNSYGAREQTPVIHARALRSWGDINWAWPHDGLQHDKGSGKQLSQLYADEGMKMLPEKATFEDGSYGVEAGIAEMLDRMQTGRWKVFEHLEDWLAEFRFYHRKDGLIVKEGDDRISSSRYAMMMKRFARPHKPKPRQAKRRPREGAWMG